MTSESSGIVERRDLPFLLGVSVVVEIRLQSEGPEDVNKCRKCASASFRALYQDCRSLQTWRSLMESQEDNQVQTHLGPSDIAVQQVLQTDVEEEDNEVVGRKGKRS